MPDPVALIRRALQGLLNGELPGVPDDDLEREIIELLETAATEVENLYHTLDSEVEEVLFI